MDLSNQTPRLTVTVDNSQAVSPIPNFLVTYKSPSKKTIELSLSSSEQSEEERPKCHSP